MAESPYLTAAQIRAAEPDLADVAKFPDTLLAQYVASFEEIAENYRGVAFTPRTAADTHFVRRDGTTALPLRWAQVRSITSVTVTAPMAGGTSTTLTATDYTYEPSVGALHYPSGFAAGVKVVVVYAHGHGYRTLADAVTTSADATVTSATGGFVDGDVGLPISGTGIPTGSRIAAVNSSTSVELTANATASATVTATIANETLNDACRQYVRACAFARRSGVPRDVISQNVEGMTTRFSTPDKDAGRPTGYLDVDRLLNSLHDFRPIVY